MSKHGHNRENSGVPNSGTGGEKRGSGVKETTLPAAENTAEAGSPSAGEKAPDNSGAEVKISALEAELAKLEAKNAETEARLAELNDQYLRKAADLENYRKRMNREKQELTDFANLNLLLDLLPVIDDFERAIKSAENVKDFAGFFEGVVMIEKRLSSQLENKWGLKRFDSEGQPFDPGRHEALQMEKSAEIAEPVVKEDYLKGYMLKEKVIRYAKVKVLMPEGGEQGTGNS